MLLAIPRRDVRQIALKPEPGCEPSVLFKINAARGHGYKIKIHTHFTILATYDSS